MADKPTTDPTWAEAATANVQEPAAQRTLGYPDEFIPPAGAHNWQFETIGQHITWLEGVAEPYANLQAYLEAQNFGADPADNEAINPGVVRDVRRAFGSQDLSLDVGNVPAFGVRTAASGRYVAAASDVSEVTVYNASDLTTVKAITLVNTATSITAMAMDYFRLYVAYTWNDGGTDTHVIECHNIDEAVTLDSTWATAGVFTHDAAAGNTINDMVATRRELVFTGAAASGAGDTAVGNNIVNLGVSGAIVDQGVPLAGDGQELAIWGSNVVYRTDNAGANVALVAAIAVSVVTWTADFDTDWSAIYSISLNDKYLAVVGSYTTGTDPTVEVYALKQINNGTKIGAAVARDSNLDTGFDQAWCFFDKDHLFVALADLSQSTVPFQTIKYAIEPKTELISANVTGTTLNSGQGVEGIANPGTGVYHVTLSAHKLAAYAGVDDFDVQGAVSVANGAAGFATFEVDIIANDRLIIDTYNTSGVATNLDFTFVATWVQTQMIRLGDAERLELVADPRARHASFDGYRLWVAFVDSDGTDSELLRSYTLGYGPRWWMGADRDDDLVHFSALPMD